MAAHRVLQVEVNHKDPELGYYWFYLTFSKNHRSLSDRVRSPNIPFSWSCEPTERVERILRERKRHKYIIAKCNYARLYRSLRAAQKKLGGVLPGELDILPMDYRRFYINQVASNTKHALWTEYTLHKNPKMIRAHYLYINRQHEAKTQAIEEEPKKSRQKRARDVD